eukprot:FR739649.1.p2 GENE.FR739649.1~~FR739649.1.p2  ORF type:complete len:116 (+),score=18.80 FR739649.1:423-770(+)
MHLLTVAACTKLGLVIRDAAYNTYLGTSFTSDSGSLKLLNLMFGIEEESKAHTWILDFGRRHQLSAMTVENGLCKVWVARYKSKVAKIEHIHWEEDAREEEEEEEWENQRKSAQT